MDSTNDLKAWIGQIDATCQFCGGRCFVPLLQNVPEHIARAFLDRGVTMLATCGDGQALDKALIGYCYDDIIALSCQATIART